MKSSFLCTIMMLLFSFQTIAQEPPLSVNSFTLVNADTDEDLFELTDGMQIDYDKLPTLHLDIRANTTADVESVSLSIISSGNIQELNNTRTESLLPYAFFQDLPIGDYRGATLFDAFFTISAVPYSLDDLGGVAGTPAELTFEIAGYCQEATNRSDVFVTSADCNGKGGSAELFTTLQISDEDAPYWEYTGGGYTHIGPIEPGTYQVSVGEEPGCSKTMSYTIAIDPNNCPDPNVFSLRINTGGDEITYNEDIFTADSYFDTGSTLVRPQTGLPEPYQSFRFSPSQQMSYDIQVPDGEYTVNLHFAELWFGATGGGVGEEGKRVFDVTIEGLLAEDNLDVFAEVGAEAMLVKSHTATVSDGVLNIDFDSRDAVGGERHPVINAIEILGPDSTNERPFIATWKTDNEGFSEDNQITIPTVDGETYNYSVDWGDGSTSENVTGKITHTYASPGTYIVAIAGDFPRLQFFPNSAAETDYGKILTIDQWGDLEWTSMFGAFMQCSNLNVVATDVPDLSNVQSMSYMFSIGESLVGNDTFSDWDVSNVTDMSRMFDGADAFNQDIGDWNVSNVTNMESMFSGSKAFNQDIGDWSVSNVTNMSGMFRSAEAFNQDIGDWDVSNVTNMFGLFNNAANFSQDLGDWNVSNVTDMRWMFRDSGLSDENYDKVLIGWSQLPSLQNGVGLDAPQNQYCNAEEARQQIADTYGWIITDAGKAADCTDFALRINAGGTDTTYYGKTFLADSYFDIGRTLVRPQTGLPEPYQSFRYSPSQQMGYNIPLENGEYIINLHFAELWFGATDGGIGEEGRRVFDVSLEGQLVEDNLDVFAEVGAETMLVKSHTVTVTDGVLDIDFSSLDADGGERHPIINAIEILGASTTTKRPFVTTWKTDNPGVSDDNQITIFTAFGEMYNYDISWGDGTSNIAVTSSITHTYAIPGTYQVSISGEFPHPYFNTEFYNGEYSNDGDKILSIDQWGDIEWRSMFSAFSGCDNIEILATDAPNLSSVEDMSYMFTGSGVQDVNLNDWDTSNVKNMEFMFFGTGFNGGIENWNVSNVTDMSSMFEFNREFNQDIGGWDVSNVSNMNEMFNDAEAFNQDIGDWDVSKVNNMGEMFSGAENFNQNIGEWNVSNVTNMSWLFRGAVAFNQNIGDWDVSNVTYMNLMFSGAENFNQNIGDWDVSNVINMELMFNEAANFNQDIGGWNVGNVTKMSFMFDGANSFDQPIGNWNVGNVTAMDRMFLEATSFNQNIGNWDVSQVVEMRGMFGGAVSFNQDIGNWNVTNVNEMIGMFSNVGLSLENYDSILNGWSSQQVQRGVIFDGGNSQYCQSTQARHKLVEGFDWRIFDGGRAPDCTIPDVFVLRINAGGSALSFNFKDYVADTYFDTGSTLDRPQTSLVGPYRTFRYSPSQQMSYNIPIPDGEYIVNLHFAELWFGATGGGVGEVGKRVFDVRLEGQLVEDNIDIFAEVGAEAMLVKSHMVTITDGILDIDFSSLVADGGVRHPIINGIEILSVYEGLSGKSIVNNFALEVNNSILTPNPVISSTTLSFEKPIQLSEIQLLDVLGRLVYRYKGDDISYDDTYILDLSDLESGNYFVVSQDTQGKRYQKQIVIKK